MRKQKKMNCERCHSKVTGFLEQSLTASETEEMKLHLRECSSCRGFLEYMQESFSVIKSARFTEPDPFFYTRLKARIEKEEDQSAAKFHLIRILQPVAISMILIAAIFAGIEIGNIGRPPEKRSYITENLYPLINEIQSEPLETFFNEEIK